MDMAINPNWARWCKASLFNYLDTNRPRSLALFIEGQERNTEEESQFIEFRFDGPNIATMDGDLHRVYVEVNCLLQLRLPLDNIYNPEKLTGQVAAILGRTIAVYKYGAETGDDDSFVGCLAPVDDYAGRWQRDNVAVFNFGQIRPDAKLWQSAIEVHYAMFVTG